MFKYRRLKDLREDRDYTQDYIADILKARRSSYANWENGETLIPLDKLDQLSVFYNVPISYLLGIKNNYNRYKNIGKMNYNLMLDKLNQLMCLIEVHQTSFRFLLQFLFEECLQTLQNFRLP